jgi:four helix bundle protein
MNKNDLLLTRIKEQSVRIIIACKSLSRDSINQILFLQVIRSATSVGANYAEACESTSLKDRVFKISICRKESKETVCWLEIIDETNKGKLDTVIIQESNEIKKIILSIYKKLTFNIK